MAGRPGSHQSRRGPLSLAKRSGVILPSLASAMIVLLSSRALMVWMVAKKALSICSSPGAVNHQSTTPLETSRGTSAELLGCQQGDSKIPVAQCYSGLPQASDRQLCPISLMDIGADRMDAFEPGRRVLCAHAVAMHRTAHLW